MDFSDPDKVTELRVVDPACGSGTLLMAAAQEILKRARRSGALDSRSPEVVRAVLEEAVYGYDVVPAAIHLAASTLCMAEASQVIKDMNLWRVQHEVVGTTARLGSLDFLASSPSGGNAGRLDLFDEEHFTRMTGQGEVAENVAMPPNCDLVIANPPYTRAGGPGKEANTIWNPMFGSLLDPNDARVMQGALKDTLTNTPGSLYAGLGSGFVVLADENLKEKGRLAFVLPATLLTGSRWGGIRKMLLEKYCVDWIVVSHDKRHRAKRKGVPGRLWVSFSESTRHAEVLIVATKKQPHASRHCVRFVNLLHNPDEPVQAMALTRKLLAMDENDLPLESRAIDIGGKLWGNIIHVPQEKLAGGAWFWAAFVQPDLVMRAERLRQRDYGATRQIPVTTISQIAELGPYHMQVKNPKHGLFTITETNDPLRAGDPALWHYSAEREIRLEVTANARLERRADRDKEKQDAMLARKSRLHIASDLRFAPQRLAAVLTDKSMLGVRSWVTLAFHREAPGKEEALCLWLNSTPGLLLRILHGNRPYLGRSSVPHELIRTMPVLDVNLLSDEQLGAALRIFEDLKDRTLKGFSQILDDPVRQELNARLCEEVLAGAANSIETLDDKVQEQGVHPESLVELVQELTQKLALEPTLHARH
ncbi:MAG: SAM-dependent DNA methyltransferase [Gammaproteobacteria bacterium]|nr:SAM-dependent DNA methyltransferase [Gammaproteobacteria bacterium]MYC23067.1 SAM-dependent DNA methyltransferase [Caldilineaceae bacterium SB0662_bin_25]